MFGMWGVRGSYVIDFSSYAINISSKEKDKPEQRNAAELHSKRRPDRIHEQSSEAL
jgi:hypothetical protein